MAYERVIKNVTYPTLFLFCTQRLSRVLHNEEAFASGYVLQAQISENNQEKLLCKIYLILNVC